MFYLNMIRVLICIACKGGFSIDIPYNLEKAQTACTARRMLGRILCRQYAAASWV